MTKAEYLLRRELIGHEFDHNEYFRQIGELAEKYGEKYEE